MKRIIALSMTCLLLAFSANAEEKKLTGWEAEVRAAVAQPQPPALPQPSLEKVFQNVEPLPSPALPPIAQTGATQLLECKPAPAPAAACPQPAPKASPPVAKQANSCANGRTVRLHVWNQPALPAELQAKVVMLTEQERKFRSAAVSRTLGADLRQTSAPSDTSEEFILSTLDAKDGDEKVVGTFTTHGGMYNHRFESSDIDGRTVRMIFTGRSVTSPPESPTSGKRELRVYPKEWGTHCLMFVHSVVK